MDTLGGRAAEHASGWRSLRVCPCVASGARIASRVTRVGGVYRVRAAAAPSTTDYNPVSRGRSITGDMAGSDANGLFTRNGSLTRGFSDWQAGSRPGTLGNMQIEEVIKVRSLSLSVSPLPVHPPMPTERTTGRVLRAEHQRGEPTPDILQQRTRSARQGSARGVGEHRSHGRGAPTLLLHTRSSPHQRPGPYGSGFQPLRRAGKRRPTAPYRRRDNAPSCSATGALLFGTGVHEGAYLRCHHSSGRPGLGELAQRLVLLRQLLHLDLQVVRVLLLAVAAARRRLPVLHLRRGPRGSLAPP